MTGIWGAGLALTREYAWNEIWSFSHILFITPCIQQSVRLNNDDSNKRLMMTAYDSAITRYYVILLTKSCYLKQACHGHVHFVARNGWFGRFIHHRGGINNEYDSFFSTNFSQAAWLSPSRDLCRCMPRCSSRLAIVWRVLGKMKGRPSEERK